MKPKPYKAMISRARKICSAPLFDSFLVKTAVEHGETDPFLNQVMTAKQIEVITELRRKARILLPESAILMGVIDNIALPHSDHDRRVVSIHKQVAADETRVYTSSAVHSLLALNR